MSQLNFDDQNNQIFGSGILWEINFSPEEKPAQETKEFMEQFQQTCERVKQEYLEELSKIENTPSLSEKEYELKNKQIDESLEGLGDLIKQFKKLMQDLDEENSS